MPTKTKTPQVVKAQGNAPVFSTALPAALDPENQSMERQVLSYHQRAQDMQIENDGDNEAGAALRSEVKERIKAIEAKRKEFTAPLNTAVKGINAFFAKFSDPCEAALKALDPKMLAFFNKKQAAVEAERVRKLKDFELQQKKARQLGAAAPLPDESILVNDADRTVKTEAGSTTVSMRWTFEVTDFAKVPDEFKTINGPAINEAIKAGTRQIPGLEVKQVPSLSSR